MREARKLADNVWGIGAMPSARAAGLRPQPATPSSLSSIPIAGPSEAFVKLTRNPKLASPARFEPTEKGPNDVVI
jgi:hypothetical protein